MGEPLKLVAMPTIEHSKLLRNAARKALGSIGVAQKGRSRTWIDDRGWWICVVEFQPSTWSLGSYLNVGCMWLWHEKDYFSFDEGYRIGGFESFQNADQFRRVATTLAERAAVEVGRYRSLFRTVQMVSDHYLRTMPGGFWPSFHAAVACGLVGRSPEARRFFRPILESDDKRDWVLAAQAEAVRLNAMVLDTNAFQQFVEEKVARTRTLLKLPAWQEFGLGSSL